MQRSRPLRLAYVEGVRGYSVHLGRFVVSQSTFLLAAAVVVGLGGGYGAVAFRGLVDGESTFAFHWLVPHLRFLGPLAVVATLMIGGLVTAAIVGRFAPEAKGHGVPEVMAAVALRGGVIRPRVIVVKSVASATCIGFGGSCGREGPIVQIGSTIGSLIGQIVRAPAGIVRTLVACGAAAGISATFNAPIGGVFFASEVILGDFAPRSFSTIVVSSVVAAVVSRAWFGDRPSFTAAAFALVSPLELVLYAVLGILAALWAAWFVWILYKCEDLIDDVRLPALAKAVAGFGLVGVIGIGFPQVFGVGYSSIQAVLSGHVGSAHGLILSILKPIATSLTLGAGGSGGVFAPSLFTGAMLGDAFGRTVHALFPAWTANGAAYGLVGMAAVFAAASEAPITAITIVFEMSGDYTIVLPLMIATVIATVLGRRLIGGTVYELKLVRRGIDWARARRPRLLSRVRVSTIVREPSIAAGKRENVAELAVRMQDSHELAVPVIEDRYFTGLVTAAQVAAAVARDGRLAVGEIMSPPSVMLDAGDTMERAAEALSAPETPLLPVVDGETGRFVGIVTRRDVLDAYRSALDL